MKHSLTAEGFGVRLRPVRMDDAAFIVWLRNLEHARGNVGDSAANVEGQKAWLADYFQRPGDYYFIMETPRGLPVGTYGIYHLAGTSAEPGRWIAHPEVPAAVPGVILALDLAFGELKLTLLHGTTVATNEKVLSLNRKLGFRQVRVEPAAQNIGGKAVDLVHFTLTPADWSAARQRLLGMAEVAQTLILDWERMQLARKNDTVAGA